MKITTNLDLNTNQLQNAVIQPLGADPSNVEGRFYYNNVGKTLKYYNGTAWVTLGVSGSVDVSNAINVLTPSHGGTGIANNDASTLTFTGNFATTFTRTGVTSVTFPTSGTLVGSADTGTVTNTMLAGSIANAKLVNSSITLGTTNTTLGATSASLAGIANITHIAGTATVAPINLTSGVVLTTPVVGALEFVTDTLSFTITTGTARKTIAFTDSALTGSFTGSVIAGQYGGTGIANTGKTITIGGNFATTGAFTTSLTQGANLALTLPAVATAIMNFTTANPATANLLSYSSAATGQLSYVAAPSVLSALTQTSNAAAPAWVTATGTGAPVFGTNPTISVTSQGNLTASYVPTGVNDVVNKQYVDTIAQGMSQKPTARLATAAPLPANVYNNGTAGVGATLTASANAALSIDGIAVVVGDIILVRNEVAPANNGLYTVTAAGSAGAVYVLTRAIGMDQAAEFAGAFIPVESEGTANKNTLWLCNNVSVPTIGTTSISFVQLNGATALTAGNGIDINANTVAFRVNGTTTYTQWSIPYFDATTSVNKTAVAPVNNAVLLGQTAGAPTWTGGSLTIPTSGSLTIPAFAVSFANAFSTTGAFSTSFTATASVAHVLPNEASKLAFLANATVPAANQVAYFDTTTGRMTGVAVNAGAVKYLSQTSSGVPTWSTVSGTTAKFAQAVTGAGPTYGPYTHGLGSADITVTVVDDTGAVIWPDISVTSTTVTLTYGIGAPTAVTHRLICVG